MPYVHVDADEILREVDFDDLVAELDRRKKNGAALDLPDITAMIQRTYDHYALLPSGSAPDCVRDLCDAAIGRILP